MLLLLVKTDWAGWLNYPGLEAWKFINLAVFIAAAIYLLGRRLKEAILARREGIRLEVVEAESAREAALAKLAEAEALLERVDADVANVRQHARKEADLERERLAAGTEGEAEKLRVHAQREIETAGKAAKKELRRFLAQRSVELARDRVRTNIKAEDDVRLLTESIGELRRSRV